MKKLLLFVLAAVLIAVALFAGRRLLRYFAGDNEISKQYDHLSERIEQPPP